MYKLVIVEDEIDIRLGLVKYIPWSDIGFKTVADFSCGNDAIAFLKDNFVDVIITDIKMDHGNGLDIAEFIYHADRLETVIFYTAYKYFDYAQAGIKFGVRQYLTKEMGFHEIIETLKSIKTGLDRRLLSVPFRTGESNSKMKTILVYLSNSYKTATLETAAQVVNLNPTYLSTYIKKNTGKKFYDVLLEIKMRKATELLLDEINKIKSIAQQVGYSDVRHFIRLFKKLYGCTPAEYRKKVFKTENRG